MKRKRETVDASVSNQNAPNTRNEAVKRDLLGQYYTNVTSLREHCLQHLPSTSRLRRKKITSLNTKEDASRIEKALCHLLDNSFVCSHQSSPIATEHNTRHAQWLSFSQKVDESNVTLSCSIADFINVQSEIVDFVIWLLFSREQNPSSRPTHLLCDGFRRQNSRDDQAGSSVPGISSRFPNANVQILREEPWPQLLALLGASGEKIIIDLLIDCSIFLPVRTGFHNYYQLSGPPLSDLEISISAGDSRGPPKARSPSEIVLVRSRIFYAKPALSARGHFQPGFKHIHVLNRYRAMQHNSTRDVKSQAIALPPQKSPCVTFKLMMYIFPRQFGLDNVFSSKVDRSVTSQKFRDYTMREDEIASFMERSRPAIGADRQPKLPKRLRGEVFQLVKRLQVQHARCSYSQLLFHYCPSSLDASQSSIDRSQKLQSSRRLTTNMPGGRSAKSQSQRAANSRARPARTATRPAVSLVTKGGHLVDLACPYSHISRFCQAVLFKLIPVRFWGGDSKDSHNVKVFLQKIDHFVRLRRFETMSLHEIIQGFKVCEIAWLGSTGPSSQKLCNTDTAKRLEILQEFLYFVFDSLVIPLLRTNFYITESSTDRYQIHYFRHDVWKTIAEPGMALLKHDMLQEVRQDNALETLRSRRLGFSQIRLLPKGDKLRPIMNLRRRGFAINSAKTLQPSINSVLGPIHTVLKLEKDLNPCLIGSSLSSVSDIHDKLKKFRNILGTKHSFLYFVKLDVQAAFDTIPQAAVLKLMNTVLGSSDYKTMRHAEVRPGERGGAMSKPTERTTTKPLRRWGATAAPEDDPFTFPERLENGIAAKKKNTIFVSNAVQRSWSNQELLALLQQHVEQNLVKVGKKFFRQNRGIPQGSVLSSFLCNYFYADLERQHLGFIDPTNSLLLRLIDDSLLVTTSRTTAEKFVNIMHNGLPDYGVTVNEKKTLANFDMTTGGRAVPIPKLELGKGFPYCGLVINCLTLEIGKDGDRDAGLDISKSLTVDYGRKPGQNFHRRVFNAFKIQSHLMFFDTSHNSVTTALETLYKAFSETAKKMWAYIRCLPNAKRPCSQIVIRTIMQLVDMAHLLLTGKSRKSRYEEYECDLRKVEVASCAYRAFGDVLQRKQTGYGQVISKLREEAAKLPKHQRRVT